MILGLKSRLIFIKNGIQNRIRICIDFQVSFLIVFVIPNVRRIMKIMKIHCKNGVILNISLFNVGTEIIKNESEINSKNISKNSTKIN